jgi:hypothetical protein
VDATGQQGGDGPKDEPPFLHGLPYFVSVWLPLTTYAGLLTDGNQLTMTDTNPIPPQEFYRIGISLP